MSEIRAGSYTVGLNVTLSEFKALPCVRHRLDPDFIAPSPDEVRFVRLTLLGWPQTKLGAYLGYPIDMKGCATVRRWERPIEASNHRNIEYNAWRRMLQVAGVIDDEDDLTAAESHLSLLKPKA